MKSLLIFSLQFRPQHVSHLVASYKQAIDIGLAPVLLVDKEFIPFLPDGLSLVTDVSEIQHVDYAIFWFPALKNLTVMRRLRRSFKCKIMYVMHEPIEKYSTYIKSGNSHKWTIRFFLKYYVSMLFLMLSDKILLPSQKAIRLYKNSIAVKFNSNYTYLPLLYYKETLPCICDRKYFSYIGTVSPDHAFDAFVDFIYKLSLSKDYDSDEFTFKIATKYKVERTPELEELIVKGFLTIQDGNPLTDEEINTAYASSIAVWNAYNRTTQSGVMAKAFMFGTPAIVLKKNLSEFMTDRGNVYACTSNTDYVDLLGALKYITEHFQDMSMYAEQSFSKYFNYSQYNFRMKEIISEL